jgi:hypothetical protein
MDESWSLAGFAARPVRRRGTFDVHDQTHPIDELFFYVQFRFLASPFDCVVCVQLAAIARDDAPRPQRPRRGG